jgi:hypothetical protein
VIADVQDPVLPYAQKVDISVPGHPVVFFANMALYGDILKNR